MRGVTMQIYKESVVPHPFYFAKSIPIILRVTVKTTKPAPLSRRWKKYLKPLLGVPTIQTVQ
jgi:hypothetical protein